MRQLSTTLRGFFRNLSKSVISSLSKSYEVPLILIALVYMTSLAPKYCVVQSKEELKIENRLSTFFVLGIVNLCELQH